MERTETVKFLVRLPRDVKRWIEEQANRNTSTQNSEIVRSIRERMDHQQQSGASL